MKKPLSLIALILVLTASSFSSYAAEVASEGTSTRKLQRGFTNVTLSFMEVSNQWRLEKNNEAAIPTWFSGAGRGLAYMGVRALAGVFEILTFPFETSENNAPIMQPEFAWELGDDENS